MVFFIPVSLLLIGYLVYREQSTKRPEQLAVTTAGMVEMCLSCHAKEKLDGAHGQPGGRLFALPSGQTPWPSTRTRPHAGMVLNPGDLRVVGKTCGVEGCHPADVHKVKNSLMATNRGILSTLLYYWGRAGAPERGRYG